MNHSVKLKAANLGFLLALGIVLLSTYAFLLGMLPEMNLVKEFNIPTSVASAALGYLDVISNAVALAGAIAALGTGGASLIAAAGAQGVKVFLKTMWREKGRKATIA